jgi:hypothetical protein
MKTNAERQREFRARRRNATVTAPICAATVTECRCVRFLIGTWYGQSYLGMDVTMCTLHNANSDDWKQRVAEYAQDRRRERGEA